MASFSSQTSVAVGCLCRVSVKQAHISRVSFARHWILGLESTPQNFPELQRNSTATLLFHRLSAAWYSVSGMGYAVALPVGSNPKTTTSSITLLSTAADTASNTTGPGRHSEQKIATTAAIPRYRSRLSPNIQYVMVKNKQTFAQILDAPGEPRLSKQSQVDKGRACVYDWISAGIRGVVEHARLLQQLDKQLFFFTFHDCN